MAEPVTELYEFALIVVGCVNMFGAAVRHETHQQVVVRRGRPGRVRPSFFHFAELSNRARACFDERIIPAAVQDDENVIIATGGHVIQFI